MSGTDRGAGAGTARMRICALAPSVTLSDSQCPVLLAASHAQAAQAAPKLQEELNATREAARRIERELRTQIAALEAKLADAARRAEEHELSTR